MPSQLKEKHRNFGLEKLILVCHHAPSTSETQNQFSLTCATSIKPPRIRIIPYYPRKKTSLRRWDLRHSALSALIFLVTVASAEAEPPAFSWARQAGGTDLELGFLIGLDAAGNSYVAGY